MMVPYRKWAEYSDTALVWYVPLAGMPQETHDNLSNPCFTS